MNNKRLERYYQAQQPDPALKTSILQAASSDGPMITAAPQPAHKTLLWPRMAVAACLLLMLGGGLWWANRSGLFASHTNRPAAYAAPIPHAPHMIYRNGVAPVNNWAAADGSTGFSLANDATGFTLTRDDGSTTRFDALTEQQQSLLLADVDRDGNRELLALGYQLVRQSADNLPDTADALQIVYTNGDMRSRIFYDNSLRTLGTCDSYGVLYAYTGQSMPQQYSAISVDGDNIVLTGVDTPATVKKLYGDELLSFDRPWTLTLPERNVTLTQQDDATITVTDADNNLLFTFGGGALLGYVVNLYSYDVTGDGTDDLCATVAGDTVTRPIAYDINNNAVYPLPDGLTGDACFGSTIDSLGLWLSTQQTSLAPTPIGVHQGALSVAVEIFNIFMSSQPSWQAAQTNPGVTLSQNDWQGLKVSPGGDKEDVVLGYCHSVYLADLNGDGLREVCATVTFGSGIVDSRIAVYDAASHESFELSARTQYDYALTVVDGQLYVSVTPYADQQSENAESYPLKLSDGKLVADGFEPPTTTPISGTADATEIKKVMAAGDMVVSLGNPHVTLQRVGSTIEIRTATQMLLAFENADEVYAADLNQDGTRELVARCAITTQNNLVSHVVSVLDVTQLKWGRLQQLNYQLTVQRDRLCVTSDDSAATGYPLALTADGIVAEGLSAQPAVPLREAPSRALSAAELSAPEVNPKTEQTPYV